jgi:sulfite reductase (NADPH) flavoprotein alpha-component
LSSFIASRTWADLLKRSGKKISWETLLPLLRPIQPRLYSIASSVKTNPGEVHIIVNQLFVEVEGEVRKGVCSTFLSEFPEDRETIKIFFEQNEVFKLPALEKDIIMIGPGTGIAPFRAFMQEREATGAQGKNWLFFGERRFTTDFYYQTEWQEWHRKSILHRVDLAFSRDQKQKVYVQHRMRERSKELFSWLENGASVYVCGDRKNMATDVYQTFLEIVGTEGGISVDKAKEYLKKLRREKRYVEDVY